MKQMILISDPHGLPLRGLAPATAAETVMICPHDKPQLGRFYNNPCMQGLEPMLAINTSLLCHPLKNNSIEPSVGEVFNHR